MRIVCERGDITEARVDAVVNAANSGLRGGGGSTAPSTVAAGPRSWPSASGCVPRSCPTGSPPAGPSRRPPGTCPPAG